jgi:GTP-binding protein
MKPLVAIVGRANVGKSRLFNRLVGHTRAIVHDRPGITRDRHYGPADWRGREYIAIDTGGIELDPAADLEKRVTDQSLSAIEEADVVICIFDGQNPPTAEDKNIVQALRRINKPVLWCVNKIDGEFHEQMANEFYALGLDPLILVSAEHGRGVDDLLDSTIDHFPDETLLESAERSGLRISMVGRPNVGKSTLINRLAGSDRVVAHEMPGTTRDAIDVEIEFEGKDYIFVDTAGVKRGWKMSGQLEKFTSLRSLRSVERSQIVCILIDGAEGLTKQDLTLAGFIREEGKGVILIVNKWDLVQYDWRDYEAALRKGLGELVDVPIVCISAQTGYHCLKIFSSINHLNKLLERRLSTSEVNRMLESALAEHHLPVYRNKELKIYYATQTGTYPPTFTLFANYPEGIPVSYKRYLIHRFQDALGSNEMPIRLICRKRT